MAFNIKINKVEDVEYTYNNENQYNHEENQNKQTKIASQEAKTAASTNATTINNNTKNTAVAADNTADSKPKIDQTPKQSKKQIEITEEIQKVVEEPAAPSFKEIQVGFVVLQEEAEEGENVTADEPGQFMKKKAKQNVFSKNVTIKEDFKQLPLSEIEKPQQSGGCCGGKSSACNIF